MNIWKEIISEEQKTVSMSGLELEGHKEKKETGRERENKIGRVRHG